MSGGIVAMGSSVLTSSIGSGTLAPAPADEKAERARSMFAHSAGPQWEDVVSSFLFVVANRHQRREHGRMGGWQAAQHSFGNKSGWIGAVGEGSCSAVGVWVCGRRQQMAAPAVY